MKDTIKMLFLEHTFITIFRPNFHKVDENLYRSSQLNPWQLKKVIKKYNIKSVLNLRGENNNNDIILQKEKKICDELNVDFISYRVYSRAIPTYETIKKLYEILTTSNYPMLIHCKAGADRTGLVATLYCHWVKKREIKDINQLKFFPFGHIKYSKAGLIDFYFDNYEKYIKNNDNISLLEWTKSIEAEELGKKFKSNNFADIINNIFLKRE